ncbi:MAG: hypothetical protein WEB88_01140, partial [Gemmatimonadota bacterium]
GNLWVLHYPPLDTPLPSQALSMGSVFVASPDSFTWAVLGPDGTAAASVRTPSNWQILEIGRDELVVLEHDSLDVQTVSVRPLEKEAGR